MQNKSFMKKGIQLTIMKTIIVKTVGITTDLVTRHFTNNSSLATVLAI